jgi:hypothetical protein
MYYHSTDPILKSRSRLFVFVSLCGGLLENINVNVRDAMGRDKYPCDLYLWFVLLMLGSGLGAVVAQYYVTFSQHMYAELLAETMHAAGRAPRIHRTSTKSTTSTGTSKTFLLDFSFIESDQQHQHNFLWFIIHLPVLLFTGRKNSSTVNSNNINNNQVISNVDPEDDTVDNVKLKIRTASATEDFTVWRRIALSQSTKYILLGFIFFPFFIACIILQFQGYPYNSQCTGCELSVNMQVGFIILALVIAILAIFASCKLRAFPDPLQLRVSLDFAMVGTCIFGITGLLMSLIDPDDLMARGIIVWGWFSVLAYAWLHSCYCIYPLYMVFKPRCCGYLLLSLGNLKNNNEEAIGDITATGATDENQDFKPLDFYQVVEDSKLLHEFEQHLRAEFAEESLFGYFAICEFEDHAKKHDDVADVKAAIAIYSTFIKVNASLQLNLPGEITEALRKIFEHPNNANNNDNVSVDGSTFTAAKRELVHLMSRDGLRRFAHQRKLKGRSITSQQHPPSTTRRNIKNNNKNQVDVGIKGGGGGE